MGEARRRRAAGLMDNLPPREPRVQAEPGPRKPQSTLAETHTQCRQCGVFVLNTNRNHRCAREGIATTRQEKRP